MTNGMKMDPLFLKCIISKSEVDTRVTTSLVRANLSNLNKYLPSIKYDIEAFNNYVIDQRKILIARGEDTTDLMVNLFKGYMTAKDKEFREFIKTQKNKYEIEGVDMTVDQLMQLAETKYKALVQTKEWNAPTKEQEQIVALTAQLNDYKKGTLKLSKHLKATMAGGKCHGQKKGKRKLPKEEEEEGNSTSTSQSSGNLTWQNGRPHLPSLVNLERK